MKWILAAARLVTHEKEYEESAIAAIEHREAAAGKPHAFVDQQVPRRAAVIWSGIADNWHGVVYDPRRTMDAADPMAFGGKLILRLHLWGAWYYVSYT